MGDTTKTDLGLGCVDLGVGWEEGLTMIKCYGRRSL
jgi:hypothetical protein